MFTKKMLTKPKGNNKYMNARWARNENHCQTLGIHRLTKKMLAKQTET